jgi:anti-sigma B factor antagonist
MLDSQPFAGPSGFSCSWIAGGLDATWVYAAGELDLATAPQLTRMLEEARSQARLVVLDLRELSLLGSSGVHAIVDASVRARQAGGRLVVLRGAPHVDRILTLSACSEHIEVGGLDIVPGLEEAFSPR